VAIAMATRIIKPTGPMPKFTDDLQICYVPNAKKLGTASYERYQQYSQGKTVSEALKLGSKRSDLSWDWGRGILHVVGAASASSTQSEGNVRQPLPSTTPPKQTTKQPSTQPVQVPAPAITPEKAQVAEEVAAKTSPAKRVRTLALPRLAERAKALGTPAAVIAAAKEIVLQVAIARSPEEPASKRARSGDDELHEQQEGDLGEYEPDDEMEEPEPAATTAAAAAAVPAAPALPTTTMVGGTQASAPAAPPVHNGMRRAVATPAAAECLSDGVLLGGKEGGLVLPVAGFGTYKLKKGEARGPIAEAFRAGYRLVDTAQVYENEGDVGAAMREAGVARSEVVLETKVWRSSHGYDRTMKAFKQSLKKLGVDYIDLYLIHWPGAKTGWPLPRGTICPPEWTPALRDEGTWRAMEDLYLAGKIKAIGVANYSIRHLQQLLKSCRVKPMVNQVEFHPRNVQTELLDFCREHGIVVQAYASLGSSDAGQAQTFFSFPAVQAAAKAHQVTPAQVLLRWALEKGALVVPKSCKAERARENAQLFSFALTREEVEAIDKLNQGKRFSWKGLDPDTIE